MWLTQFLGSSELQQTECNRGRIAAGGTRWVCSTHVATSVFVALLLVAFAFGRPSWSIFGVETSPPILRTKLMKFLRSERTGPFEEAFSFATWIYKVTTRARECQRNSLFFLVWKTVLAFQEFCTEKHLSRKGSIFKFFPAPDSMLQNCTHFLFFETFDRIRRNLENSRKSESGADHLLLCFVLRFFHSKKKEILPSFLCWFSFLKAAKKDVTSKSPVEDKSVVTLIRTDYLKIAHRGFRLDRDQFLRFAGSDWGRRGGPGEGSDWADGFFSDLCVLARFLVWRQMCVTAVCVSNKLGCSNGLWTGFQGCKLGGVQIWLFGSWRIDFTRRLNFFDFESANWALEPGCENLDTF